MSMGQHDKVSAYRRLLEENQGIKRCTLMYNIRPPLS